MVFLCTASVFTQSLHDLPRYPELEGLKEIKSYTFSDIDLDDSGKPVLVYRSASVAESKFENGFHTKTTTYSKDNKKEMEFVTQFENGNLSKVEVFSQMYEKRMKLFKWYQIFYKGDEISHENIYYDRDDLRGTVNYIHSTNGNGDRVIESVIYKPNEDGSQGGYNFVFDENDKLINKVGYTPRDTGLIYTMNESIGDSVSLATVKSKQRNSNGEWVNSTAMITTTERFDSNDMPVYQLTKIEAYDMKQQKDVVSYSLTILQNTYTDGTTTGGLHSFDMQGLSGAYFSKYANIIVTFTSDGGCELSIYDEAARDKEMLVSTEGWGHEILAQKTCEYFPETSKLTLGGNITDEITIESIYGKLKLTRPDMSDGRSWDWVTLEKLKH